MPNGNQNDLWDLVNRIYAHGCARREDDMVRIKAVEDWVKTVEKKLDYILYTTLGTLVAAVAYLLKLTVFK